MSLPQLVRRVPVRPTRFASTSAQPASLDPRLMRRMAVRPARFVVGLEELEEPWPDEVLATLKGAPQRAAIYLGRVEEVGPGGELTVTVWEAPSGREAVTTLSSESQVPVVSDDRPQAGDMLRIWTWLEIDEQGAETSRAVYQRTSEQPGEADLAQLDQLISSLEQEGSG